MSRLKNKVAVITGGNSGIGFGIISPGTTDTPVFDKFVPAEQLEAVKKYCADVMPIGRIGQPSDIGKTAVFLASDDSSFMLGAELLVDGSNYVTNC
jgi:NAD(P)-dependent dehydrogenase (short-subunit alcohol dehydrogenase family)